MSVVAFKRDSRDAAFERDAVPPGPVWLNARREKAMTEFERTGIPSRRNEAWKYTDLAQAMDAGLIPATPVAGEVADDESLAELRGARIVFANGHLSRIEAGEGIEILDIRSLANAPEWARNAFGTQAVGTDQPLGAAALGLMQTGLAVRVARKDATLSLQFENPRAARDWIAHARILVVVEEGASLRLVESHARGEGESFLNLGLEFVLMRGAHVEHLRLQRDAARGIAVASIGAKIAADAKYRALYVALGGKLARVDAHLSLDGENASAEANSIALIRGGIADTTTIVTHAEPHTHSRQMFKSVVGEGGRSVSQGRVSVREGAVKADSHQLFKALLLSPRAEADAKPELEILADDVTCGHGTAIGALDADSMFYLRARGIPEGEARELLVRAFLEEAMEGHGDEELRALLWRDIDPALKAIGAQS